MKTIGRDEASAILERDLGVAADSALKDKNYVLLPAEWYLKPRRRFLGFKLLPYITDGFDCDDWQTNYRAEMAEKAVAKGVAEHGGLPMFQVKAQVSRFHNPHEVVGVICDDKKAHLFERVRDGAIEVNDLKQVYNVYPA